MTKHQINQDERYNQWVELGQQIRKELKAAMATGNPNSPQAQKVALLHSQWLEFTFPGHTPQDHAYLIQNYRNDGRFVAYYESVGPGASDFLCEAILAYTKSKKA